MDFKNCPKCLSIRMFDNGKCQTCGYISVQMASINALYLGSTKKDTPVRIYEKTTQNTSVGQPHKDLSFCDYGSTAGGSSCDSGGSSCDSGGSSCD